MEYGIQLYGMRDVAEQSLENAVKMAADIGYSSVEFAGFFDRTPEQVKEMLAANNIKLSGTHTSYGELLTDLEKTLAYHKAIGNKHFIIPALDLTSQDKLDDFVKRIGPMIECFNEEGITISFHNHSREFERNADGSYVFDQLLYRTNLKFEVDCCWAHVGMGDPIALLERVGDRLTFIHLKDALGHRSCPLGQGDVPIKAVHEWAVAHNIPMVVESESLTPDGPTEARICLEYLKSL